MRRRAWAIAAVVAAVAAVAAVACTRQSAPAVAPDGTEKVAELPAPEPEPAAADAADAAVARPSRTPPEATGAGSYALVVSFFSPGNGTDGEAYERLLAIVKATSPPPSSKHSPWGMEGEHDECFTLGELDEAQRRAFIARVRAEVGTSRRVRIKENAGCESRHR